MKNPFIPLFLAVLLSLSLTACQPGNTDGKSSKLHGADATLDGKIARVYDDGSFLLADDALGGLYAVPAGLKVYDANDKPADSSALKAGTLVRIGYSGTVMESYPMQLGGIVYIKITGQGDDMIGFYKTVFDELWNSGSSLNNGIKTLAFDLTKTTNLSEGEKSAFIYLTSGERKLTGIAGTFEELKKQGYLTEVEFKNGLLFTFEVLETGSDTFKFEARKWRANLSAYGFGDCVAVKSEKGWSYTKGNTFIS